MKCKTAKLAANELELITHSAVAQVGSLVELQLRIYWHWGGGEGSVAKYKIRLGSFS